MKKQFSEKIINISSSSKNYNSDEDNSSFLFHNWIFSINTLHKKYLIQRRFSPKFPKIKFLTKINHQLKEITPNISPRKIKLRPLLFPKLKNINSYKGSTERPKSIIKKIENTKQFLTNIRMELKNKIADKNIKMLVESKTQEAEKDKILIEEYNMDEAKKNQNLLSNIRFKKKYKKMELDDDVTNILLHEFKNAENKRTINLDIKDNAKLCTSKTEREIMRSHFLQKGHPLFQVNHQGVIGTICKDEEYLNKLFRDEISALKNIKFG